MVYATHKLLTIGMVLALLFASYLLWGADQGKFWIYLWFIIIPFGYTHYLLGAFYQLRSFSKHENRWRLIGAFVILTILSIAIAIAFVSWNPILFLFFVLSYFMLHGIFNEQTLYMRQTAREVSVWPFVAIGTPIIGLLVLTLMHPSGYFAGNYATLAFSSVAETTRFVSSFIAPDLLTWSAILFFVGGLIVMLYVLRGASIGVRTVSAVLYILVAYGVFTIAPLPYTVLQFLLLMYHFVVWLFFIGAVLYKRGGWPFTEYVLLHVVILVPLWGLAVLQAQGISSSLDPVFTLFFNIEVFIVGTFIHITTSFLNEPWAKKLLVGART